MADIVTLSCPACGGPLEITPDVDRFSCAYCGNKHMVHRDDGVLSLGPVFQRFDAFHATMDRTAAELALPRLKEELAELKAIQDKLEGSTAMNISNLQEQSHRNSNNSFLSLLGGFAIACFGFSVPLLGSSEPGIRCLLVIAVLIGVFFVILSPILYVKGKKLAKRFEEEWILTPKIGLDRIVKT